MADGSALVRINDDAEAIARARLADCHQLRIMHNIKLRRPGGFAAAAVVFASGGSDGRPHSISANLVSFGSGFPRPDDGYSHGPNDYGPRSGSGGGGYDPYQPQIQGLSDSSVQSSKKSCGSAVGADNTHRRNSYAGNEGKDSLRSGANAYLDHGRNDYQGPGSNNYRGSDNQAPTGTKKKRKCKEKPMSPKGSLKGSQGLGGKDSGPGSGGHTSPGRMDSRGYGANDYGPDGWAGKTDSRGSGGKNSDGSWGRDPNDPLRTGSGGSGGKDYQGSGGGSRAHSISASQSDPAGSRGLGGYDDSGYGKSEGPGGQSGSWPGSRGQSLSHSLGSPGRGDSRPGGIDGPEGIYDSSGPDGYDPSRTGSRGKDYGSPGGSEHGPGEKGYGSTGGSEHGPGGKGYGSAGGSEHGPGGKGYGSAGGSEHSPGGKGFGSPGGSEHSPGGKGYGSAGGSEHSPGGKGFGSPGGSEHSPGGKGFGSPGGSEHGPGGKGYGSPGGSEHSPGGKGYGSPGGSEHSPGGRGSGPGSRSQSMAVSFDGPGGNDQTGSGGTDSWGMGGTDEGGPSRTGSKGSGGNEQGGLDGSDYQSPGGASRNASRGQIPSVRGSRAHSVSANLVSLGNEGGGYENLGETSQPHGGKGYNSSEGREGLAALENEQPSGFLSGKNDASQHRGGGFPNDIDVERGGPSRTGSGSRGQPLVKKSSSLASASQERTYCPSFCWLLRDLLLLLCVFAIIYILLFCCWASTGSSSFSKLDGTFDDIV